MGLIDNMQHLREDEYEDVLGGSGFSEADATHQRQELLDENTVEYEPGKDDTYDPVRTYLAALGAVPLLKREQEVALAKQIERGEKNISFDNLVKIAAVLGVTPSELLSALDNDAPRPAAKPELRAQP